MYTKVFILLDMATSSKSIDAGDDKKARGMRQPKLPPIVAPEKKADRHANSRLLNFRMAKHREAMLHQILYVVHIFNLVRKPSE